MWFNTKQKAGILLNYNEQKQKKKQTKTSQQEVCEEASNEKEI